MSLPLKTGFPDAITCAPGYIVRFTATDPADGSLISGVTVSDVSLFVESAGGVGEELPGPFMLVPGPDGATV